MHEANFHTKARFKYTLFLKKRIPIVVLLYLFSHIRFLLHRTRNILEKKYTNICFTLQVHVHFLFLSFLLFRISRRKQLQIQQINFFHVFKKMTWSFSLHPDIYILGLYFFISFNSSTCAFIRITS